MSDATGRRIADALDMIEHMLFGLLLAVIVLGMAMLATFNMSAYLISAAIEAQTPATGKAEPNQ